jgi:hypothetical protein
VYTPWDHQIASLSAMVDRAGSGINGKWRPAPLAGEPFREALISLGKNGFVSQKCDSHPQI